MRLSKTLMRSLALVQIAMLLGCAGFRTAPLGPPLTPGQIEEVISGIKEEDGRVLSFYERGTILAKSWYGEGESNIVIVGSKDPFRVKIEVTHTWGQPVLHILIDRDRLEVLSFAENKLYEGNFTPEALSRFIPGPLSPEMIWSVLRGYPAILPHTESISPRADQIDLLGAGKKQVETLELNPADRHPERVLLPAQQAQLNFSDIQKSDGIAYAREVGVDQKKAKGKLFLRNEKMVFNKPIPEEVFTIERPPGFMVVQLEQAKQD